MMWKGLTCLVTGASSGIGLETAHALARRGATVIAVARREERLAALIRELGGDPHSYLVADISELAGVRALAAAVAQRAPSLDILINNAGMPSSGSLMGASSEEMEKVIKTNLLGAVWCTKELLPLLQAAGRRRRTPVVVNVASMAGRIPAPDAADYTAAKFGLVGFTEAIWGQLGHERIRTMMVNPGLARTEGFPMDEVLRNPVGRWLVMSPERVARALVRGIETGSFEVRVQWWMHPVYFGSVCIGPFRRMVAGRVRRSVGNAASGRRSKRQDPPS